MSTPGTLHPRRLFCNATPPQVSSPTGIDSSSCVRPSLIAQQERQGGRPLLAPSPSSPSFMRTHVEVSAITNDVENLIDYINAIEKSVDTDISADSTRIECAQLYTKELEPLKSGIEKLVASILAKLTPPQTPKNTSIAVKGVADSAQLLSADLRHLRTIQKEVRGLFKSASDINAEVGTSIDAALAASTLSKGPRSPSPIRTTPSVQYPASFCPESPEDPQTATKISRDLAGSPDKKSVEVRDSSHFSRLTLSPTTELFDQVKANPWFSKTSRRRRSGSLPPPLSKDDQVVMSSISTIPDCVASGVISNRQILVQDESLTVSALHAAMARRRAPSLGGYLHGSQTGTADLANWLRKQTGGKTGIVYKPKAHSGRSGFPESSIYRN